MTMPLWSARKKLDKHALAAKAAVAVIDDGVTQEAACGRFGIGWKLVRDAVRRLRSERAAGGRL